ncbi:MAG: hypothetical protein HYS13_06315 [Planctomycetia bacterium]|nr:hypothetical protein [Planctomycetia bacterium]
MTRHLFILSVLCVAATPLAADDAPLRLAAEKDGEPKSLSLPPLRGRVGVGGTALLAEGQKHDGAELPDVRLAGGEWLSEEDAPFQLADDPTKGDCPADFHPVCDCDCRIPCLDCWCDGCPPCCTTECYGDHGCECALGNCYQTGECGQWVANDAWCDVWGEPIYVSESAVRFGWWGVSTQGPPTRIGEFQDLKSSPFFDVDAISSDGVRTWDISLTGLDNEANDARVFYYGPGLTAKVNYERFLRRWDHDPLVGFDLNGPVAPTLADNVVTRDTNVGEDYAIRVQQLDARFQGQLTDRVKWRLNVWGLKKSGERQANATAHCFNIGAVAPPAAQNNACHVLSQRQRIDWETLEIQPVVEARYEAATVEYSRTWRAFGQSDEFVDRNYTRFGFSPASGAPGPDFDYAIVPESLTQIDRLKVGAALNEFNQFYANVYHGDTKNEFRGTHREFSGFDLRVTNSAMDTVKLTGYVSMDDENNELPTVFFNAPPLSPANNYDRNSLRHPVDYTRTRAGVKGRWQPLGDCGAASGFSLAGGYEYYMLTRDFAEYDTALGTFVQPDTISHEIEFGPAMQWSRELETYVRYRPRFIEDPLIGVREANGRFNSNQPEQVHSVDIGGSWNPTWNFMATAQFSVVNSWHHSEFAYFNEDDYPIIVTAWYAPTERLSVTGGYGYYSNWVDQDITLGFTTPGVPVPPLRTETTRWQYGGVNHLASVNLAYAWTETVHLIAGYEYNRGRNVFNVPPSPAGANWSLLPFLADVIAQTQRFTAGADWQPYGNLNLYARYVYFDWDDVSSGLYTGRSHMVLGGGSVDW